MKSIYKRLTLASTIMLFGCTTVHYTQQQVMDHYKTRQDFVTKFGLPNEKIVADTGEKWLYRYSGSKIEHPFETEIVPQFGEYKNYIILSFDKQGNVIRWQAKRVEPAVPAAPLSHGWSGLIYRIWLTA